MLQPIETERLRIRDVRPSDVEPFCRYMTREDYWCNLPMDPPTPQSVHTFVERCLREQNTAPRTSYFLAAISPDN